MTTDAVQLSLSYMDVKEDASLHDFGATGFVPVVSAVQELIDGRLKELYIFGESGSGKSHLLSAIHREYLKTQRMAIFVSLKEMINTDVQALMGLEMFELILIDDIHLAQGRREWQEGLFHLINRARSGQRQLIYSAISPPNELLFDLPDLSTRLSQAFSCGLPDGSHREDRQALLKSILRQKGWQLPDTISDYLVDEGPHYAGDMIQVLTAIVPYFNYRGRKLPQKLIDEIKNTIKQQSLMVELADIDFTHPDKDNNLSLPLHY